MEDKETELISKVIANHLFLGQFEPFRAMLRTLRSRSPDLARTVLQTIISQGGRMGMPDPVLWSDSCPSPAILTFLCTLELLEFPDATSNLWSFDPDTLKLRSEFLLYVHIVSSRVLEVARDVVNMEGNDDFDEGSVRNEELRVLERLSEVGTGRLKPDLIDSEETERDSRGLSEGELMTLRGVILENSEIFDVLCANIEEQLGNVENEDLGDLAITVRKEVRRREEKEEEVLRLLQKCVQLTHLDAMRQCLENGDEDGGVSHVRFLHLNCGVEEKEYRMVVQDLLKRLLSGVHDYGDASHATRNKVFLVYKKALSSHCTRLVQMLQLIQDDLLSEEIEVYSASEGDKIPLPLQRLKDSIVHLKPEAISTDTSLPSKIATSFCMRDIYHYARVQGLHTLECIVDTALSLVQKEQIQEACQVLMLFPRLQPLIAALGWDLLAGKTTMRRKLMQSLWTTKSQALRLEESSPYDNKLDEASCVEHLCDTFASNILIHPIIINQSSFLDL